MKRLPPALLAFLTIGALLVSPAPVVADRVVLAPSAHITLPGDFAAASVWNVSGPGRLSWLHFGYPQEDLGLELELSAYCLNGRSRETLGIHYSVISEAASNNLAPGVAIGIRDLPNRGYERRSAYLALSKTMRLTEYGERLIGTLRLHAGYGSGSMGGAYLGASVDTPYRVYAAGELLARRLNWRAAVGLAGPLSAEYVFTNGRHYAGFRLHIVR